ncbi:MAG: hypothetical protein IJW28_04145 [Clostridia bacterium]|nr:hypothetical protein [Clostridia bacterium]
MLNEEGRQGLMGMFQAFGFDHGDDYEKYIKDPKLINAIFDEDFLFKINELEKAKILKTFEINPQFLDAKTRVDDLDLATGNLELSVSLLTYLTTPQMGGFIQNHFTKDGKLQVLCVCPMASSLDDEVFIHEAGHAIHSSIISRDGNHYKVKNGIETLDYYAEEEFYDTELLMKNGSVERKAVDYMPGLLESNRKYKILNEVLHDVLTKMLLQMAKERGLTFGHKTDNPTTLYSNASSLVEDFVKNNLPLLKDSYMGDDPELFVRSFGTENLDKLASAVENVVTISMSDRDAIMEELNVDNIFSKDMLAFAKQSKKYSSRVRAYLDNYLTADSAIKDYEHSKQM